MAKKRLTMGIRDDLNAYAKKAVKASVSTKKLDAAYDRVADLVRAEVEAKFPPADMEVLSRYSVARADNCIRLVNDGGGVEMFQFRKEDDRAPVVPSRHCSSRGFLMSAKLRKAKADYEKASDAYDAEVLDTLKPYQSLIRSSRTAEDVIDVWPASKAILEPFMSNSSTALVSLSEDEKAAIQRTNVAVPA